MVFSRNGEYFASGGSDEQVKTSTFTNEIFFRNSWGGCTWPFLPDPSCPSYPAYFPQAPLLPVLSYLPLPIWPLTTVFPYLFLFPRYCLAPVLPVFCLLPSFRPSHLAFPTVAEIQFRRCRGEASRISDKFVLIFHCFCFF